MIDRELVTRRSLPIARDLEPLAEGGAARLVEEANRPFDLNVGLFSELDALRAASPPGVGLG
jgi:heme oxygenase